MEKDEDAAITYKPDAGNGFEAALAEAERQISNRNGVNGMGMTKTSSGEDAIVVYVQSQQVLSELPAVVGGFSVIGEITGEIVAQ